MRISEWGSDVCYSDLDRQRPGYADTLAPAALELMRIAPLEGRIEPDPQHYFIDVILDLLAPHDAMNARCLADYVAHPHPGIERGEGILKDHLHLQRAVGRRGPLQRGNRRSTIMDGALRRLQDAGDDPAERRLSTARLADQTNDLP